MRGYLVGNGVFDFEDAAPTHVPFAYGHGFLSTAQFTQITAACQGKYVHPSAACSKALAQIDAMMVDVNGYDAYRTCYHPQSGETVPAAAPAAAAAAAAAAAPWAPSGIMKLAANRGRGHPEVRQWLQDVHAATQTRRQTRGRRQRATGAGVGEVGEVVPCINSVKGTAYLNEPAVRKALHVDVSPNQWAICGGVNYTDDGVFPSMIAVHKEMIDNPKYAPRVLVYNGDVDPGCNYLWAEASVARFGVAVATPWRPWVYADARVGEQLGGFTTAFAKNVTFATVHGAGHMSPQWRPEAVFTMLSRFLDGKAV